MTDAPQAEMIHPYELLTRAEIYARNVPPHSPMAQMAKAVCTTNNQYYDNLGYNGMFAWQVEIFNSIIRDTIIQLGKDQCHD